MVAGALTLCSACGRAGRTLRGVAVVADVDLVEQHAERVVLQGDVALEAGNAGGGDAVGGQPVQAIGGESTCAIRSRAQCLDRTCT